MSLSKYTEYSNISAHSCFHATAIKQMYDSGDQALLKALPGVLWHTLTEVSEESLGWVARTKMAYSELGLSIVKRMSVNGMAISGLGFESLKLRFSGGGRKTRRSHLCCSSAFVTYLE